MAQPGLSFYKFKGAPSGNIPFPAKAKMTAIELLTFLPNHLTSADVVIRFASNQGTYKPMVAILDAHRTVVTPNLQNLADYCQRNARKAMRDIGHQGWILSTHRGRFAEDLRDWDSADLNVGHFRTRFQINGDGNNVAEVPFVDLAEGVTSLPKGDDALDLTRLVHHCLQHPEEKWMYPTQYAELLETLGPEKQVTADNEDGKVFNRWKGVISTYAQHRTDSRQPPAEQPTEQVGMQNTLAGTKRSQQERPQTPGSSSTIDLESPERRQSTRLARPSRKVQESMEGYLTDDSQDNNEQLQPKRRRIDAEDDLPDSPAGNAARDPSPDARPPLRWMKPPTTTGPICPFALRKAFNEERAPDYDSDDDEADDPWAPYAFPVGPRIVAPFRPLHLMNTERLRVADVTSWAENLRWAREQFLTFGETGWTESPEHMDLIAEIRMSQVWASGPLMISIQDEMAAEDEEEALMNAMMEESQASMQYREPILGRDNGMSVRRDEYGNPMGRFW